MDFADILKTLGDPAAMDKEVLSLEADAYFERLYKMTGICYHLYTINENEGEAMLKKFKPVIALLSEKIEESVNKYQEKHGEL